MAPVIVPASGGNNAAEYTGKLTLYVFFVCLAAASGGLLFGYDIGVTGGVTSMPAFLSSFFPSVAAQQQAASTSDARSPYCKFDSPVLQLFTSSLFLAGLVSSLVASGVTRRCGRKASMLVAGLAFLVGAAMTSCAGLLNNRGMASPSSPLGSAALVTLVLGRVSLGVGVGFANQAVPLFLNEMSPAHLRGAFNIMFQLATTIGIILAQLVNVGASHLGAGGAVGWRISLALAAVPAVVLTLGGLLLPDTPNSLAARGKKQEALKVLRRVRGVDDVAAEFDDICLAADAAAAASRDSASGCSNSGWSMILRRKYRPELTMAVMIPLFQQLTGINAIMFYAPVIFSSIGMADTALVNTAIVGAVNVIATLVAVALVDRAGRRPLFLFGGAQMAASQVALAALLGAFFRDGSAAASLPRPVGVAVIAVVCAFVAAFAFSWGPLGWLVPAEVQPLETRSVGQSINVSVNFLLTALMGQVFVSLLCALRWGIFLFFAGWVAAMTAFVFFLVPETRGVPIEEMRLLWASHPFWRRFVPADEARAGGVEDGEGEEGAVSLAKK